MIKKIYYWLLQKSAKPEDRGGISAGYWQGKIRGIAVDSLRSTSGRVLDIGCGEGLFLRDALKACPDARLFGIDLALEQLVDAKKKTLEAGSAFTGAVQAEATALPFGDNIFDKIVFINLVINMPGDDSVNRLVLEAGRVCKKGGSVIFDIRNRLSPFIRIKYGLARYYDDTIDAKKLPLTMSDPLAIESVLKQAGLEVVNRSYLGFPKGKYAPVIILEAKKIR